MPRTGVKKGWGPSANGVADASVALESPPTPNGKQAPEISKERELLIQERQAQLGSLLDRHDDLLREAFHMEKFVTLLYYDPTEAKKDQTAVFREYKEKHLLGAAAPVAGPSRITRRAQNERISTITSQAHVTAPIPSQAASTPMRATKRRVRTDHESISAVNKEVPRAKTSWRGKQKMGSPEVQTMEVEEYFNAGQGRLGRMSAKARGKQRAVNNTIMATRSSRSQSLNQTDSTSPPPLSTDTRLKPHSDRRRDEAFVKKRHRTEVHNQSEAEESISSVRPNVLRKTVARKTVAGKTVAGKTVAGKTVPSKPEIPNLSKPSIKRIRLIVKKPPPLISSPLQKPAPAQFGQSLSSLLSSYTEVNGKTCSTEELEKAARHDAKILDRAEELRKQGRLIHYVTDDDGGEPAPEHQPNDLWSTVVREATAARSIISRHRFGRRGVLAHAVHSRLLAYWEAQRTREDREAASEEKRLRMLARTTLRLVLGAWRRVEFHVREEERREVELEERRLGQQHLNEILNQSGQILEKQQKELGRAYAMRSRSGSASLLTDEEDTDIASDAELGSGTDDGDEEISHFDDEVSEVATSETGTQAEEYDNADTAGLLSASLPQNPHKETYVDFAVPLNDDDSQISRMDEDDEMQSRADEDAIDEEAGLDSISQGVVIADDEGTYRDRSQDNDAEGFNLYKVQSLSPDTSTSSTPLFANKDASPDVAIREPSEAYSVQSGTTYDLAEDSPVVSKTILFASQSEPLAKDLVQSLAPDISVFGSDEVNTHEITQLDAVSEHLNLPNGHSKVDTADEKSPLHASPIVPAELDPFDTIGDDIRKEKPNGKPNGTLCPEVDRSRTDHEGIEADDDMQIDTTDEPSAYAITPAAAEDSAFEQDEDWEIPEELQSYAVARVKSPIDAKIVSPLLLRGILRPYQHAGLEWLAKLHRDKMNGILADEMGLGKTIQTIALLAHLACDHGIWGPHLIIVPTSVLLNWEMEFKKFLPGFRILSYHGSTKRRKELRRGWLDKHNYNACVTSYALASRDQHIFKRKAWYYMILDEAHMIKNFKSQRWNILLMFKSSRRLLLTGTPLQNNLTELWALLQFLMSGTPFANLKEFGEWFSNPLEKAIEQGNVQDDEVQAQVGKLHLVLRPYLLRRLKRDVEKELPSKYEHLVLCRLSKRQRFLYDEFMARNQTRQDLASGVYQKIANILMQLRKVCNHPDLFEVRPIVTSFAMDRSAIADFEIKELLVRRRLLEDDNHLAHANLDVLGLRFTSVCNTPWFAAEGARLLEENLTAEVLAAYPGEPPPRDLRTIDGYKKYSAFQRRQELYERYNHMSYLNRLKCSRVPVYSLEMINVVKQCYAPLNKSVDAHPVKQNRIIDSMVKSYEFRANELGDLIDHFTFATPAVVARDLPSISLREVPEEVLQSCGPDFDAALHRPAVKLQIAFPDVSLLQYDCGKLQELARLLRERKTGGHRVLIFTQMTRILDILEMFLNFHGYLYLRLDGATKIEDRQYVTERFNVDQRVFAFIASSRSGGVGINLTGADTVIFYDSDFNPQMDRQCEDRAHRIGQIRDVHIYRFISQHTIEENLLRKANQKRSLDNIVIQQGEFDWGTQSGEFDWKSLFGADDGVQIPSSRALQQALVEFEDVEDAHAAEVAAREEAAILGEDRNDFGDAADPQVTVHGGEPMPVADETPQATEEADEDGGVVTDYMIRLVRSDREYFREMSLK